MISTMERIGLTAHQWLYEKTDGRIGANIGRRVYLDSTEITEFDLVTIGDHVAINIDATIQTHLFEDRVMKIGEVYIGPRCNVGSLSVVLYDTRMGPGSALGDLSLLMKGEALPSESRWVGTPARPCPVRQARGPHQNGGHDSPGLQQSGSSHHAS